MTYSTLIDTEALSHRLGDPDWVVVDCRFDLAMAIAGIEGPLLYAGLLERVNSRPGPPRRPGRRAAEGRTIGAWLRSLILLLALGAAQASAASEDRPWLRQYKQALRGLWSEVYREGGKTLYCGAHFGRDKGTRINAEHVFPMSWVARELGCGTRSHCRNTSPAFNRIEDDLHNIFPALAEINEARGARRYGEIPGEARAYGSCDVEIRGREIEPGPQVRGDIARAMFYMRQRYGLPIYRRQAELLARWNREDPPDATERARNDRIQRIQGRRNPYIDNPGLARLDP